VARPGTRQGLSGVDTNRLAEPNCIRPCRWQHEAEHVVEHEIRVWSDRPRQAAADLETA
jgi:hypothetical protein